MKKTLQLISCVLFVLMRSTGMHAQIITTVAGSEAVGYSGDGAAAVIATLSNPYAIAFDGKGNLYITDEYNNCIRKVDTSGIITTVAGTGVAGYNGDGIPATAAQLNNPSGIAADYNGNIYFSDVANNRIRMVSTSGNISTIAGTGVANYSGNNGPATAAMISRPGGVAVDAAGNIYFADYSNECIRKIDKSGIIITVAGVPGTIGYTGDGGPATAATLNFPISVAVDKNGNMYVGDFLNNCVRKIDGSGTISTIAGNGTAGFIDSVQATAGELNQIYGVAVNDKGDVFISDFQNSRIRKVDKTTGMIYTVAGTGATGYNGDGIPATTATLYRPTDVAFDRSGNLYIADYNNNSVREVNVLSTLFNYTGTMETYTVPQDIYAVRVDARGATGGLNSDSMLTNDRYGYGAAVICTLAVTPGEVLNLFIGGSGQNGSSTTGGVGGFNGGGSGSLSGGLFHYGGGGGGATDIRVGGTAIADRKIIAAGGGGAGWYCGTGGAAGRERGGDGGLNGEDGSGIPCALLTSFTGGAGGNNNTLAGGDGGICIGTGCLGLQGSQGSLFYGGSAVASSGGGGGGGYYGGGGGQMTGGGGGSSYADASTASSVKYSPGLNAVGNGYVSITPICPAATGGVITGMDSVCAGATTLLNTTMSSGVWTSGDGSVATIGSSSGKVTGLSTGVSLITYTVTNMCGAGSSVFSVTVLPKPSAITGASSVCLGHSMKLSDATAGGTWSSDNLLVAPINTSGFVVGAATGLATISYTAGGCFSTTSITVNAFPTTIIGPDAVCTGLSVSLSNASGAGVWNSSAASVASIGAGTGILSGINPGTAMVTFTPAAGCAATLAVTVNPSPAAITGVNSVCAGLPANMSNAISGGLWSSGTASIASVTSGGQVTGLSRGIAVISYSLGSCVVTKLVSVTTQPAAITGPMNVCAGNSVALNDSMAGGTWSTSNAAVATAGAASGMISGIANGMTTVTYSMGAGCETFTTVTVNPTPAVITGASAMCTGLVSNLSNATMGGIWTSSNATVAPVSPTGNVTGMLAGTTIITYSTPAACMAYKTLTVNAAPAAISGTNVLCEGAVATLSNASGAGTWVSSDPSVVIDNATGAMTGIAAGISAVSYLLPSGCMATATVTVNPLPSPITGASSICTGIISNLSNATNGGLWSSSDVTILPVATTGNVTGMMAGTAMITYSLPATGCGTTKMITVNPLPSTITGVSNICTGIAANLSNTSGGGSWSSSDPTIAATGMSSGVVTGISAGAALITYSLPTGCVATKNITILPLPATYAVSGGGSYCAGGAGLTINLNGSDVGVNYQLYNGASAIGSIIPGTGAALNFGIQAQPGMYTVLAANNTTACVNNIPGTTISVNPLPALYTVTGGGNYCIGSNGVHVALSGSDPGIIYQLYNGGKVTGGVLPGATGSIDFGPQSTGGIYTVVAMDTATACTNRMTDSATISVNIPVVPSVSVFSALHDTACEGTPVAFHVTATNGGDAPYFEWRVDGKKMDVNDSVFSYIPDNGNVVVVTMMSNASCVVAPGIATSEVTVNVAPVLIPAVSISVNRDNTIIAGKQYTLTATVTGAGETPSYQWLKNGTFIPGATAAAYSNTFNDGDSVTCVVFGSGRCGLPSFNSVVMNVSTEVQATGTGMALTVAPNPSKGIFTINGVLGNTNSADLALEITNMLGQVVYTDKLQTQGGMVNGQVQLDNTIPPGAYLLNLGSGTEHKTFHIIIE